MLEENQYKIQYRVMLARYRGKTICPEMSRYTFETGGRICAGRRKEHFELVDLPITEQKFFDHLNLNEHDSNVARRILIENQQPHPLF